MIIAAPGSRSDGLRTSVFPVTAAMGIVHRGIMLIIYYDLIFEIEQKATYAGKLNGAMLAQTPSGNLLTSVSISLLTK